MPKFESLENSVINICLNWVAKSSSCPNHATTIEFVNMADMIFAYIDMCKEITDKGAYSKETLKDGKNVINASKMNIMLVNAIADWLIISMEDQIEGRGLIIELACKAQERFEVIMKTIRTFAFKVNQRLYEISQDSRINIQIVQIIEIFTLMACLQDITPEFVRMTEELRMRYEYIQQFKLFDLRNAEVVVYR